MEKPRPKRISDFKPTLTNLAQTSHYEVRFGRAAGGLSEYLRSRGVDKRFIIGEMGLLCNQASLPFSSIATTNITGAFTGITEKFAHSRTFIPINLNFYVDKEYKVIKFLEHWMEYTAGGTHAPGGRTGPITQNKSNYYIRMQYPDDYRMEETKIIKFERDYSSSLEYTFFNLFPQNVSAVQIGYDASKILTASATFEYTRYVCGPISNISKYRSGAGFNNLTVAELKEMANQTDVTRPDAEDRLIEESLDPSKIGPGRGTNADKNNYSDTAPPGQQYGPMASDVRLKENITKVGNSPSGINIYEWNYKGNTQRYRGVMAQEILERHPEAVALQPDGYMSVYYGKIDVKMEMVK